MRINLPSRLWSLDATDPERLPVQTSEGDQTVFHPIFIFGKRLASGSRIPSDRKRGTTVREGRRDRERDTSRRVLSITMAANQNLRDSASRFASGCDWRRQESEREREKVKDRLVDLRS